MTDDLVTTWWCIPSAPYVDRAVPVGEIERIRGTWIYPDQGTRKRKREHETHVPCAECGTIFFRGESQVTLCSNSCRWIGRQRKAAERCSPRT